MVLEEAKNDLLRSFYTYSYIVIDGPLSNYNGNRYLSLNGLSKSQVGDWSL